MLFWLVILRYMVISSYLAISKYYGLPYFLCIYFLNIVSALDWDYENEQKGLCKVSYNCNKWYFKHVINIKNLINIMPVSFMVRDPLILGKFFRFFLRYTQLSADLTWVLPMLY